MALSKVLRDELKKRRIKMLEADYEEKAKLLNEQYADTLKSINDMVKQVAAMTEKLGAEREKMAKVLGPVATKAGLSLAGESNDYYNAKTQMKFVFHNLPPEEHLRLDDSLMNLIIIAEAKGDLKEAIDKFLAGRL